MTYIPGKALSTALVGDVTRREGLVALVEGISGLSKSVRESVASFLRPRAAYAQSASPSQVGRVSVEDYYRVANNAEHISPGARIGQYRQPIKGTGFGFLEEEWQKLYGDRAKGINQFYGYLSEIDGKTIKVDGTSFVFDSKKLIDFIEKEHGKFRAVAFYGNFMFLEYEDRSKKVVVPLTLDVIGKIRTLIR
jgi:hypothetical protein